jgi:hypothetical protein
MANNKKWVLLMLTLGIVLVGCGKESINNINEDVDKVVTFSLEQIDYNSFSLTINGADWSDSAIDSALCLLNFTDLKCKEYMYMDGTRFLWGDSLPVVPRYFSVKRTGKIVTATIKSDSQYSGYSYSGLFGTLSLTVESINNYLKKANVYNPVIDSTLYAVESNKSTITF